MALSENPSQAPQRKGLFVGIGSVLSAVGSKVRSMFKEDPRVKEFLTPELIAAFKTDYLRMKEERREGIYDGAEVEEALTFVEQVKVAGGSTDTRLFKILLKKYGVLKLPENVRREVIPELVEECSVVDGAP